MNKAVLACLCFVAGAGFGFGIGYYVNKKNEIKQEKEPVEPILKSEPEKQEEVKDENPGTDIFKIKPAKLAKPGEDGVNYRQYVKKLKYAEETEHPTDEYDENDISEELTEEEDEALREECTETYEERLERESEEMVESMEEYKKAHKGKIDLMTQEEWDSDFPEADYEREDLYYFTEDDVLTNEDGDQLDKEEYLGKKVGQIGWYKNPDNEIYIRKHPKEKEYRVLKELCSVEDWWS